jgi:hypothetical protein
MMKAFILLLFTFFLSYSMSDEKSIYIDKVDNKIQVGSLAGNRNIAFGVKNIITDILSENYSITDNQAEADYTVKIELVFLDVEQSNVSVGILHQDQTSVVIAMKGYLIKDGKVIKTKTATEKSSEISMSTLVISEAGGFNQQSLSNALKKASVSLTTKLLDKI